MRQLERAIARVLRKVAAELAAEPDRAGRGRPPSNLRGLPRAGRGSRRSRPSATAVPGVATGLAVTGAGGDVLFVEAIAGRPGDGRRLTLTGQLGDVMKESAQIALSYLRSHGARAGAAGRTS